MIVEKACPVCHDPVIEATTRKGKTIYLETPEVAMPAAHAPARYQIRDGVAHHLDRAEKAMGRPGRHYHDCPGSKVEWRAIKKARDMEAGGKVARLGDRVGSASTTFNDDIEVREHYA